MQPATHFRTQPTYSRRASACCARERPTSYTHEHDSEGAGLEAGSGLEVEAGLQELDSLLTHLSTLPVDELSTVACEQTYHRICTINRKVQALQTRLYATIEHRRTTHATTTAGRTTTDGPTPSDRRIRGAQHSWARHAGERNRQTPAEINEIRRAANGLTHLHDATTQAFRDGLITARHIHLLSDTLQHVNNTVRNDIEPELLNAAQQMDPTAFGRLCRKTLAEHNYTTAVQQEQARHKRRRVSTRLTDDGMLNINGELSGIDAETLATALTTFRQPDPANTPAEQRRTPQQTTSDALIEICRTALAHVNTTNRGTPPQVLVTIDYHTLLTQHGTATTQHLGNLPFHEVRRLLADAGVSRLLTDPDSLPVEAGRTVRTVPTGLWKILQVRDKGCTAKGCDRPAGWCDVAHLHTPHRHGGTLTPSNTALLCRLHHRKLDLENWAITWRNNRPIIHHPDQPPSAPPATSGDPSPGTTGGKPSGTSGGTPSASPLHAPNRPPPHRRQHIQRQPDPTQQLRAQLQLAVPPPDD